MFLTGLAFGLGVPAKAADDLDKSADAIKTATPIKHVIIIVGENRSFDHRNPQLWAETAIFVTVDEGGGFYDSGFIHPVDFFGTGPRIPMIAVSPFSTGGHVSHVYNEHSSFVKFVERNWMLHTTLSNRSRDNFSNPDQSANSYVPRNMPAIGDLFDMFDFDAHK